MIANRTIFVGDNLPVLRGMDDASIDLIYLDPPFNSKQDYSAPVGSKAAGAWFQDTWSPKDLDEREYEVGALADQCPAAYAICNAARACHGKGMWSYLCIMGIRLVEMRRVLKPTGSIYLHCDPYANSYLRLMMDAIFGRGWFRREIAWAMPRPSGFKTQAQNWIRGHDSLLYYADSQSCTFNKQYEPYTAEYLANFNKADALGPY